MSRRDCRALRMSPNPITLHDGAILIADAHYDASHRPWLLDLLQRIADDEMTPPQLVLMGDIFDLLFGPIPLTHRRNATIIALINRIARKIDVIYLEGNHDFQLASLFPHVRVVPLEQQPLRCRWGTQTVLLAHGDTAGPLAYRLYTGVIRNRVVLLLLRFIDDLTNHALVARLDRYLSMKNDCYEIADFEALVKRRFKEIDYRDVTWIMEGHFHQNRRLRLGNAIYVNLGAFACNQRYYELQSKHESGLIEHCAI